MNTPLLLESFYPSVGNEQNYKQKISKDMAELNSTINKRHTLHSVAYVIQ